MFDKVTVSRNMKELKGLSGQFSKVAQEANSLQERMTGLYEDMGNILGRYYSIGERHVPGHDDEDSEANESKDMMFREDDGYKEFFKKAMKKFGISSPDELKPEDEKDFYNYVDRNYKAKNEADDPSTKSLKYNQNILINRMRDQKLKTKDPKRKAQLSKKIAAAIKLRDRG